MTGTAFEYRTHYDETETLVASGLRRAEVEISDADLGDEEVLIHECSHIIVRGRFGPDIEVHSPEFVEVKDRLRVALGHEATGLVW